MDQRPEQVIRRHLEQHGDLQDVPMEHLLVSWRLKELTPSARVLIGDALAEAGVHVEPSLDRAPRRGPVALSLERQSAAPVAQPKPAPPEPTAEPPPLPKPRPPVRRPRLRGPKLPTRRAPAPAPPQPEPAAAPEAEIRPPEPEPPPPPEPEVRLPEPDVTALLAGLRRPRALVLGGGLIALISLWLPWVKWSSPVVVALPFDRSVNAWSALGLEPVAIVLAAAFGAAALVPASSVPESWRSFYGGLASTLGLAFGGLAVIVSLASALSPPDSSVYGSAEARGGPLIALLGSVALTAGAWLARPESSEAEAEAGAEPPSAITQP